MQGGESLRGIRILLTTAARVPEAAQPFVRRGALVSWLSLISIGPPPDRRALEIAAARCGEFAWLAFTSRHGVESFARALRAPLEYPPKIAAIGPATAVAVGRLLGRGADLVAESFVAEGLAEAIQRAAAPGDRILVAQAEDARPVLVGRLHAAGFDVVSVPAYTTREEPARDITDDLCNADVLVLASGSAARSLAKALGGSAARSLRGKVIACIGPVTLSEARRAGFSIEVVPEQPTFESLASSLAAYFGEKPPA